MRSLAIQDPPGEDPPGEDPEFLAWFKAWQAEGYPSRLGFAARFTLRRAALQLKRGESAEGIRLELWSRALTVSQHLEPRVKAMFLGIIRQRLEEALGPAPDTPPEEKTR